MAKLTGLMRIGRDAEVRYLQNGDAVFNLSLVYNYGKKADGDKNKPSQWVEASMFGKRAEQLAPWLLKGNQIVAVISDIHIETYEGKNGQGHKLVGRLDDIELTDRKDQGQPEARSAPRPPSPPQQRPQQQPTVFNADDDDIPF